MTNNIQKKKKRSEQILIEHEEKQIEFDKLVEEDIKVLELTKRECDSTVNIATTKLKKKIKTIILERGKYLENNLELVPHNSRNYICRELKKKYKGVINPTAIWFNCPEEWKSAGRVSAGQKGGIAKALNASKMLENASKTPLTEYEKQYVEVHEQKVYHNEHIAALIDYYLGLSQEEKTDIIAHTPKDRDYQNVLIEKAKDNILRIVKRLNDVDIAPFLADIRFLGKIHRVVSDVAYEEQQLRKKKQEMIGK